MLTPCLEELVLDFNVRFFVLQIFNNFRKSLFLQRYWFTVIYSQSLIMYEKYLNTEY